MKNYYQILGVKSTVTKAEIKRTYRKLAKQFHPDTNHNNKDAEEKFKEVAEAYDYLYHDEKRKNHDFQLQQEELRLKQEYNSRNSARTYLESNPTNFGFNLVQFIIGILIIVAGIFLVSSLSSGNRSSNT